MEVPMIKEGALENNHADGARDGEAELDEIFKRESEEIPMIQAPTPPFEDPK